MQDGGKVYLISSINSCSSVLLNSS